MQYFRNGHMLTHRNKKPYECKAEGCGKSYCDARSLRRHTENHHAGSKVNESTSPSSPPTTGPNTPNTPGSNPSTPSTPVPSQNGHGHTALKQLLASEPVQSQLKVRILICFFFHHCKREFSMSEINFSFNFGISCQFLQFFMLFLNYC